MPSPQDKLKETVGRLRFLGSYPPTENNRSEVINALNSKWDGVVSVAIQVLCNWNDSYSMDAVRRWLMEPDNKKSDSVQAVFYKHLKADYRESNYGWLLDFYFAHSGIH